MQLSNSFIRLFLLGFLSASLVSCASYMTRKSCEATNWFEYGEKIAMDGRRTTGDQFVNDCRKAEADIDESQLDLGFKSGMQKYCTPDGIYKVGRDGNFFNTDMCSTSGLNTLRLRHNDGVLEYCKKANGYSAGASGKEYNKICPRELERDFLPEFNRGRRRYLSTRISQNQGQIGELEIKASKLKSELAFKRGMMAQMQASNVQTEANAKRASALSSEINSLHFEITGHQNRIENLKSENRKLEIEIVKLGG